MKKTSMTALLALVSLLWAAAPAAAQEDAQARTQAFVKAFEAVVPLPEGGPKLDDAQRKANLAAFAALDAFFDYDALLGAPLEPHAAAFKAGELERFKKDFRELVRLTAYPGSGAFFREAQWSAKAAPDQAGRKVVVVQARVEKEDLDMEIRFFWSPGPAGLRLVDVAFDGASLLQDYRNQFGRIIAKEGAAGLARRLAERLTEQRKATEGLLP